jgi:D-sedoheptulose 7-phosphate isomerase
MSFDERAVRERIVSRLQDLAATAERAATQLPDDIAHAAAMVRATLSRGGTLFFCGNGGSAADAQHVAAEYVVRYILTRRPLKAVALTTDTSLLTAAGNDFGFEEVFARQVEALAMPGDLLIVHTTSGTSENILRAVEAARAQHVDVLALTAGSGGRVRDIATHTLVVPTPRTDRAQELHLCIEHIICELVEDQL